MKPKTALRCCWLVVVLICGSACSRSPADYLKSGQKYFDAGKYEDAVLLYRKAIQKDPKYGDAYYHLALAELKQGKLDVAYQALTQASAFAPENEEIQRVFADFCYEIYTINRSHPKALYDKVSAISKRLLDKNPSSYDGLRLKGYLAIADRKPGEAIDALQKADQLRPMQPQVIYPLTRELIQDNKVAEAEKLARALIQKDKTFGPMYDLLFALYAGTGRQQDAENILKAKVDNNPKQAAYVLNLAAYYWAQKRQEDGKKVLQRLLDNPKDFQHPHALVGDFYLAARDLSEARNQYNQGIQADPKEQAFYQKKLVNLLIQEGQRDDAKKLVGDLVKSNPKDEDAQLVQAILWIESGKPQDVDAAINVLKPLAEKKPEDANRRYRLGQAYQAKGKMQQAEAEWRASAKDDPALLPPRIALAEADIQSHNYSEALLLCDEIQSRESRNPGARFLRAAALAGLSRPAEARLLLDELLTEYPNSPIAKLAMGRLDLMQGHFSEAEKLFTTLYHVGQPDLRPLDGLVTTYLAEKEPGKAVALLEKELQAAPENAALIARYAEANISVGNYSVASAQYRRLLAKDPNSGRLNRRIAEIAVVMKDSDTAIRGFERAAALDPKDAAALSELGSTLLANGRKREALDAFRKVLALNPDQPAILNNVAYLIADTGGDTNEAMNLARKGLSKLPNDPHLNDTIGYIYWKQHHNDSAVQTFKAVVQKDPENSTYHLHLANALLSQGDKAEARTQLELALMRNPPKDEESEIKSLLAQIGR